MDNEMGMHTSALKMGSVRNLSDKTVFSPSQNPRLAFPPEAAAFGRAEIRIG
jgi:hypothetical protein